MPVAAQSSRQGAAEAFGASTSMQLDSGADAREGESSFSAFARVLQACKDLDPVSRLDPDRGTALLFADACSRLGEQALDDIGATGHENNLEDDDRAAWLLEQNTWTLVHMLTSERLHRAQRSAEDAQVDSPINLYETPLAAIQSIFEHDDQLNELRIIREWLQETLPPKHVVEVRKGYLTFTKNRVRAEKRASVGGTGSSDSRRLTFGSAAGTGFGAKNRGKAVKNLDPDAVSRGEGGLELEDATYEKALLRTLFEYTRAGRLDAAFDLCHQTDQSWRAATLRGAMLYYDPRISERLDGVEVDRPIGNRNRALWKSVCRKLASNPNLDEYERALYGSLAGELASVSHVSQTWEECLWAHINAKLESSVDAKLDSRGSWWGQDADADVFGEGDYGAIKLSDATTSTSTTSTTDKPASSASGLAAIFDKLGQMQAHSVHLQANNPFRLVQRSVISNSLQELLGRFADNLGDMQKSVEPATFARLLRFFSHLILYLRLLEQPLPDFACNAILSAYVQVLEAAGESSLVAMYASSLEPQSATASYSNFLRSMDINTSREAKASALRQAEEHSLDLAAVANCTTALIFDELFSTIAFDERADMAKFDTRLEINEEALIKAVDWLTFDPLTYADAIVQSNALTRLFLSTGRLHAAKVLRERMPSEVLSSVESLPLPHNQKVERSGWDTFFSALEAHVAYRQFWSTRPLDRVGTQHQTGLSRLDRLNWTKALSQVVERSRDLDLVILQRDWLKISPDLDVELGLESEHKDSPSLQSERRRRELFEIRQIYIPEIVLRLHDMLVESSEFVPAHLNMAVRLAEIVADERHKIYLEFVQPSRNLLKDYLLRVREASLDLLDRGDVFEMAVEA
ncbi:nucleoporin [Testicularia cyperi]|uniref:Nuclear pore complex protein n=1 Tax=Testicularia cyperi TaxID=1882483 RepID=A0A317XHQ4_9BASI|nr:nucleoporin [Testicularia cyperi]